MKIIHFEQLDGTINVEKVLNLGKRITGDE